MLYKILKEIIINKNNHLILTLLRKLKLCILFAFISFYVLSLFYITFNIFLLIFDIVK